jgi:hypothetical protein
VRKDANVSTLGRTPSEPNVTDSSATPPSSGDPLQFDRVEGATTAAGMTCASCGNPIVSSYYDVNGNHVCLACKGRAERANDPVVGFAPFAKAFLFGGVACLIGAGIYYGVAALLNLEIGLIAILIGYMVGAAVRKATNGGGGRRYQVLALLLTYFAIGLAYTPFAVKGAMNASKADSTAVASGDQDSAKALAAFGDSTAASSSQAGEGIKPSSGGFAAAFAILLGGGILVVFALPVLAVFSEMPGGLISAAIIGFGMQQAWKMTAAQVAVISGPYRVGGGESPPAVAPPA